MTPSFLESPQQGLGEVGSFSKMPLGCSPFMASGSEICGWLGRGGVQQTQPWRNRRDLLSSHSHHLQLSRGLICTLWISVYPPGPSVNGWRSSGNDWRSSGNGWRSALGELGRGRGWPSIAAAIPTSVNRGSPPPCRGPGADPGSRGGRGCASLRPIAAAPSPHWSPVAGGPGRPSFRPQFL